MDKKGNIIMGDSPFFSIVMPVYNSEEYLDDAILSILHQTYGDFELIIVDDCSTDKSAEICKKYEKIDKRIRYVKTKGNKGVSNARNLGISYINGQYCTFIDSDDWVDSYLLENIFSIIKKNHVDIVKYSVIEDYIDGGKCIGTSQFILKKRKYEDRQVKKIVPQMWADSLFSYLCNGFYNVRSTKIDKWHFDTNFSAGEDILMNLYAFNESKSLYTTNYCGYHYAKRKNYSLSTNLSSYEYMHNYGECIKIMKRYCCDWGVMSRENRMIINWIYLKFYYQTLCRRMMIENKDIDETRRILRETYYKEIYEREVCQCIMKRIIVDKVFKTNSLMLDRVFAYILSFIINNCKVLLSKLKG